MNVLAKSLLLCFSAMLLCSVFTANAESMLSEEQSLNVLLTNIKKDKLYENWTTMECLSFVSEDGEDGYHDVTVLEKHGSGCPGDPVTAPVVDRFRVNRLTKLIEWFEPVEGAFYPYSDVLKAKRR